VLLERPEIESSARRLGFSLPAKRPRICRDNQRWNDLGLAKSY
jgi:hypothetical protein